MQWASLILLLGGCDRVFGLIPLGEPTHEVDATTTIDAPAPTACPASYTITLPPAVSTSMYRLELGLLDQWDNAADDCERDSMTPGSYTHLVVLSNDRERELLNQLLPAQDMWIGLADIRFDMEFEWVTAESTGGYPALELPPWEPLDPHRDGAGCVTIRNTDPQLLGTLGDNQCVDRLTSICECDGYPDTGRLH